MKALVLTDVNKFEYKDVACPSVGDDDVLINIKAAAICGSDVHGYDGSSGRRRPPLIIGHEASGVIDKIGSKVVGYKVGDSVTFDSTEYCGVCGYCKSGKINLCDNRKVFGVSCGDYERDGAMAEYLSVPSRVLYKVPEGVSFVEAAMVEPLSIAFHAINQTDLKLNDTVLVVGAGTIGMLTIKLLKQSNCGKVIVSDLDEVKLEMAKKAGADVCLNPAKDDVKGIILDMTNGKGVDVVFEAVGASPTVNTAVECVKKAGIITLVGNIAKEIKFPLQSVVTREISLNGSCASAGEYDRCLDMIANKKIDMSDVISKVAPLADGQEWFDRLHAAEKGLMKVVLTT